MNKPREDNAQPVKPIEAPDGIELHPKPQPSMCVSKRAGLTIGAVAAAVLAAFAYGGYKRQAGAIATARESPFPKKVAPADTAAKDVLKDIPAGAAPVMRASGSDRLHPPGTTNPAQAPARQGATCGFDPRTGQAFRFNPDTGRPCTASADRVIVRPPPPSAYYGQQPAPEHQMTPEERQIAAAYTRELEARSSPLTSRGGSGPASPFVGQSAPGGSSPSGADAETIVQALATRPREGAGSGSVNAALKGSKSGHDTQNAQTAKATFLAAAREKKTDDYLQSTRTQPLSPYEIKAGWEIPAVLEQGLNSDLPGELKALVSSNVFDTATGKYLPIPQGSRLVGSYDSRVSYGQDGVMVVWQRIIYPDASSVDIDGMVGLDSHGNAGLRDKVDRHYKRLFGFEALTSAFEAAFSLSQRNTQSALTYPSPTSVAGAAVGQELSQTGAQVTRQNLNVQPTIRVPAG